MTEITELAWRGLSHMAVPVDRSAKILRFAQDDDIAAICAVRPSKKSCHPERSEGHFLFLSLLSRVQ
jgi:hypothetical protein